MGKEPIIFCWSGGKDSAMALHELRASGLYDVVALLTTVSEDHDRICMHGVRRALLIDQADAVGIPLHEIRLAASPTNAEYEAKMDAALALYRARGISKVGFGDIFLEDLKAYRDRNLAKAGMSG
ncbi:MAG: ATP-binding protein, partial [Elusimicrobia bacterium]|nr:ATP-binding protein [Elusimicrobiota bacterium]